MGIAVLLGLGKEELFDTPPREAVEVSTKMNLLTLDYGDSKRSNGLSDRHGIIRSALVLDEGHKVRNFMSTYYQLASQIRCQAVFPVTATPMWNLVKDVRPLRQLIATASGISSSTSGDRWNLEEGVCACRRASLADAQCRRQPTGVARTATERSPV